MLYLTLGKLHLFGKHIFIINRYHVKHLKLQSGVLYTRYREGLYFSHIGGVISCENSHLS